MLTVAAQVRVAQRSPKTDAGQTFSKIPMLDHPLWLLASVMQRSSAALPSFIHSILLSKQEVLTEDVVSFMVHALCVFVLSHLLHDVAAV